MRKLIFILLVCFTVSEIEAQVPGYRGKKFMLGYSVHLSPNVWDWVNNYGGVPLRLHPKHIFDVQYITGRHTIFALEGGFMQYKRTLINFEETSKVKLNGGFIGTSVKMFGNHLAPVGHYFSLNAQQSFMNFRDEKGFSLGFDNVNNHEINGNLQATLLGIGFGTKRVYANAIVADMGIGLGCSFTSFKDGNILLYPGARSYASNIILFRQIVNYKIGISGLLF